MKKELLISKMAILLFFCVFLFNATAQAQCFLYYNETDCTSVPGCHWCPTNMKCYQLTSDCPTCDSLSMTVCSTSSACHWCDNQYICFPQERPCTCGNKIVEPPEQCDRGRFCTSNCTCPEGYENDGGNGCKRIGCGNGTLEAGEECEPVFGRFCDPVTCKCTGGTVPDPDNPGFCVKIAVCGDGTLDPGEQCELYSRNCVDCVCVDGTVPDPVNVGFCIFPNNPPVLETIGNQQVDEGQLLQFTITATDPDLEDVLSYSIGNPPAGSSFAGQTFSWTPDYNQAGNYKVLFSVTDDGIPPASASEEITITVGNVNRPPELASIGDLDVKENQLLQFTVTATDPDLGDVLTYSASDLPDGASFGPNTQIFSWKPAYNQAGTYPVTFTVTDNGTPQESDSETIIITVGNINRPPKLDPIGNRTVNEGEKLEIVITATDPDGDRLTYSTSNLPAGATFDPIAQKFSWTPGYNQAGEYQVTFNVSDGEWSASETITITVNNVILQATIHINPETLNLKSKGGENSMTAYIELPGGYDVRQISVASIRLNVNGKTISAQPVPTSIGDYDGDGFYDLMVKFDRQAVISALGGMTGQITMTVIGNLNNGSEFFGSDTIKVINPGK